jgi:hypothetical protein
MKGGKMEYTKESIRSQLQQTVMKVEFTKTDGNVREMLCTLQESFTWPYEKKTDKVKPENNDVIAVWDIEKQSWRSFRIDSILSASVVEAYNV